VFVLEPFDAVDSPEGGVVIDLPVKGAPSVDALEPITSFGVTLASVAILVLLGVAGYGWARLGIDEVLTAIAAAPAVGVAVVILAAVALDVFGVAIGETPGAIATLALAGGGGYLARFVLERRTGTRPAPQVEEQPAE
jgi:hypothetical protein